MRVREREVIDKQQEKYSNSVGDGNEREQMRRGEKEEKIKHNKKKESHNQLGGPARSALRSPLRRRGDGPRRSSVALEIEAALPLI